MGIAVKSEYLENLKSAAKNAPLEPGVYIWRDIESRIIYVGKAKVLRNRLQSYFSGGKDVKTAALIRHACSIETIIAANEYEALLLENTLIKQHSPKYNINLKDGKTYPVVRISAGDFPKVYRTRRIVEDGSLYFGPYSNIQGVDKLLEIIERTFPLRKCRTMVKRDSPCMYYHIGRCTAPCCGRITPADYAVQVERVRKLLAGETNALVSDLKEKMNEAAKVLKYEEAARLRNAVRAIEELSEPGTMEDRDPENRDYIAWANEGIFTVFSVFSVRGGRVTGRELFSTKSAADEGQSLDTFIAAYYSPDKDPPPKIFFSRPTESNPANDSLKQYFEETFGFAPLLLPPDEKRHIAALAMARQNALEELRRRMRERGAGPALDELRHVLNLKTRPERIEGFDIAQLDGKHPVASLISFKNGIPDKKNYRYFKLRTVVGIVDDFESMREAVRRRYSRLLRENAELPDLILIDGGIGQVNAAKGVMEELGADCGIAGLAKQEEEIYLPGNSQPIRLSRRSEALKVLQYVRDETHRFATNFNQKLRSKDIGFKALESVEGIGPKRAAALMKDWGSLEKIAAASPRQLADKSGVGITAAKAVHAAAVLSLQDQAAKKERLSAGSFNEGSGRGAGSKAAAVRPKTGSGSTAALAALAAEDTPEYGDNN
ncbi:MAG: excinuclease ABC subunit UvrC [Treponema sp.]|nr:excinuclease ABC subunit UvrC [Treponema sp.]